MADEANTVLAIKGLSGGYGRVPVLHGIELAVGENQVVGILGHNGMGKSTLLKTLMGFLKPTGGSVHFRGEDITGWPPNRRVELGIGYVPQGRGIFPQLTVRDNMRFAYHDHGQGGEDETFDAVLDHFPRLVRLLDREGGTLSGGEQQLLALARCLMADPEFLLLDEPTEGIQPSIIEEMSETLDDLRKKRGLSVLLVEQNFDFIADLSDRVVVLERGRLTGELSKQDLTDRAKVDRFLGFGAARSTRRGAADGPPGTPLKPSASSSSNATATRSAPANDRSDRTIPSVTNMTIKRPSLSQMHEMAQRFGMHLSDQEIEEYREIMEPYIQCYDRIDAAPDYLPEVRYPRAPGYRPSPSENPLNAWFYKTDIKGAPDGPLRGKRIALKDTVCVAGVPMMNGSSIMEGYVPEIDATIVTRILDAGGIVAGKAHCENLCISGGSHTNATGPVHNPWKHGYMAGGSSSGSAALVAAGEVDMAIAGDQGGSVRIPSSSCGVYGMKPTHGLVPYTGVMPVEQTIDHVGPVTGNVADNALFLEVLAGEDGLDPRQRAPKVYRYTEALNRGCSGLRIGVLKEGFGRPESEADVDGKVEAALDRFRELGARVEEVSVEEHYFAADLWTAITVEGLQDHMMHGNCGGTNYRGLFLPSMIDQAAGWRHRADELSHSLKVCMFLGEYFQNQYRGRYYGKAQNLMRKVHEKYLEAFARHDLLVMPTLPMKPQKIPPADCSISLYVQRAFEMIGNTAPFNGGLPAMTVPCGLSEGLPIGMMLVGPHYGEMTIYQAAHAFEQSVDWRTL
ncbi:amidase [Nitratireductor sp. XY-223]|uniref:amidase n=1 Tax=Nitratireductor sp. XY-223 TaxID=2561926 RepID=UPI0010A9F791|nr:amidase [Nitratireductor sp. XY-223]